MANPPWMDLQLEGRRQGRVLQKVGQYDIGKAIGRGNFAIVRMAKHRIANRKVAIKIVDKHRIDEENLLKVDREIRILKTLDHPHIIKLYEVIRSEQYIYLVTEYAHHGELFELLAVRHRLTEPESRKYFQQIVSAIAYCHHRGIVHRDIKAENVLLDRFDNVKIIDFGFSNIQQPKALLSTWCGSPPYAAPELLLGKHYDGTKADIWSLGVVLYIIVTGGFPFAGDDIHKLKNAVVAGQLKIPFFVSVECADLIRKMLVFCPERRLTIDVVAQHRWFVVDLPEKTRKLLRENPADRLRPDMPVFKPNHVVTLFMLQRVAWTEAQITDEVMRKNYESPIYATYEILSDKLEDEFSGSSDTSPAPRRGSRGSITTGKVYRDDEEPSAPTVSARALAKLGNDTSSEEETDEGEISDGNDVVHSPAHSWALRHAVQLGTVAGGGVQQPTTSFNRAEARRHTLCAADGRMPQLNELLTQQAPVNDPLMAHMALQQAAAAVFIASSVANPFLNPAANLQILNSCTPYDRISTLPTFERRASADPTFANTTALNAQLADQLFNTPGAVNGLLALNPCDPPSSAAANTTPQHLHPGGVGGLSIEEEGEMYLKRFGHVKRNTFHSLGGSPGPSTPLTSVRRTPYARQPNYERRSSWTSTYQNMTSLQQVQLERLYRQSIENAAEQLTNIQQLQKEFQELSASTQAQQQLCQQQAQIEVPCQAQCPPLISITDENNRCVNQHSQMAEILPIPCNPQPLPEGFFDNADVPQEEADPPTASSFSAYALLPPSENSTLISNLETDKVIENLRSTLTSLSIVYGEEAAPDAKHKICVENGQKSRIEINVSAVPLSISQAKSRIQFSCTGSDQTGCSELCTELINKLKISS